MGKKEEKNVLSLGTKTCQCLYVTTESVTGRTKCVFILWLQHVFWYLRWCQCQSPLRCFNEVFCTSFHI